MKMKALVIFLSACVATSCAAKDDPKVIRNLIPSWGDITLVHGPGTDAAMDTPQAMDNIVKYWKGRGFTGVYLRADLDQFPPGTIIRHTGKLQTNAGLAVMWKLVDEIMAKADPHESMRAAAEKNGFEYWLSLPHIFSEGAPDTVGVDGPGRMVPWSYMMSYHRDHPEWITVDREGNKQWMVPEYGYAGQRAAKAAEFAHMAKKYRPTGIIASMRSETSQLIPPPDHADQYGFSPVVVQDMKRLYGVDIMTDPRFDWKSPTFKSDDEMLEKWRDLRGGYITQLYREIRAEMRKANPKVKFAVGLSGEHVGPLMGNARLEWRKWVDEGLVDVIIASMMFEATLDMDADKKGYLTNTRAGIGLVSVSELREYIKNSKHPEIQIIQTGAPSYFYPPPPEGADGWQCDAWYDSYNLAIYQRWEQWKKDLRELGCIQFFKQDFDSFAVKDTGAAGGLGDGRHHPELRASPGVWYKFGNGSDDRPTIQDVVRHGDSGHAVALTGKDLTAVHYSSPDRSLLTGQLDTAIVNGNAQLSFYVYRATEANSLTVYFSGNSAFEKDVAIRVAQSTGRISCANGSDWKETDATVPLKQWYRLSMQLDLESKTYSVSAGSDENVIANGLPIKPATERFVTQHGVESIRHPVPSYRIFNQLMFLPTEGAKEPIYIDDVLVQWKPNLRYSNPGSRTIAYQDFEKAAFGSTRLADGWRLQPDTGNNVPFSVERTTSFGPGVQCLRASGGGAVMRELGNLSTDSSKGLITLDMDLFIRSDKDFPYMIPDLTTRSSHDVTIGLQSTSSQVPLAQVHTAEGTWRVWDGSGYVDSKSIINYDVWNHLQLVVDTKTNRYRVIVQPVGEMPTVVAEGACGEAKPNDRLKLVIKPSATAGHISCYDNILVTSN